MVRRQRRGGGRRPATDPPRQEDRLDPDTFHCRFEIRWDDLDGNRHVRNTVFSDFATHTRFRLLESHGFGQAELEALRFGPVMMAEEIRYRREARFGEELVVTVRCAGLSPDSSHWRVHQEVLRPDGRLAVALTVQGGWLDLESRRLTAPPAELARVLQTLPRTSDFEPLPSLLRRRG